ncbi:TRAP transporter substrate-binding protein [Microlunatus phosphovorus]|nr:TRAP transporter substrate-binding protein DctP [Microlunatus phosphovorus]
MSKPKTWSVTVVLLAAALMLGGCQAKDRAGGTADVTATELRFASTSDIPQQITAWADEVDQLSNGSLKITFVRDQHAGQPDYEVQVIDDVRSGHVDLAWVGARAFDQTGVTAFQPLLAPMLIDSLELQGEVFDAGIPQQLLTSLDQTDLVGIGILPGPMRKVLGIHKPFTKPSDFTHQVVGIQASAVAEQTFTTLGATTKAEPPEASLDGLDAYEQQLSSIQGNRYVDHAEYVTGNLNLWPRPLVIIGNPDAYQKLTDDQRTILTTAAKDAIGVATEAERTADARAIASLCKSGLTFEQASNADLANLHKALVPVTDTIHQQPGNAAVLDQITDLKNAIHRAPESADCAKAESTDQPLTTRYDGTYEMTIVWPDVKTEDARCVEGPEGGPGGAIYEMEFDRGTWRQWVRVGGRGATRELGAEGQYRFFKDQLQILEVDGSTTTWDYTYTDGELRLSNPRNPESGVECIARAIFTTKPWIRQ